MPGTWNIRIVAWLASAILALLCAPAFAADKYTPEPLRVDLLTERVDEHDKQICDLDERLTAIEDKLDEPREIAVRVVVDDQRVTAKAGAGELRGPQKSAAVVATSTAPAPAKPRVTAGQTRTRILQTDSRSPAATRLKTTAELSRDIAARRTSQTYATISPATLSWAQRHLQDHGYTSSQVAGLSYSDAWMLHNLAHSPSKISPYTSGAAATVSKVDVFVPTPRTPPPAPPVPRYNSGCPGGRCPTTTGRSVSNGWYPGKLLFGR